MPTALVTDPTAGIGVAFARLLGATGHDLVLVGQNERRLRELATELADRHDITVEVIAVDLADRDQRVLVEDRLRDNDLVPVDLVVNNVTDGGCRGSWSTSPARFDPRVTSVLGLTHAALGCMVRRRRGAVINVFSVDPVERQRCCPDVEDAVGHAVRDLARRRLIRVPGRWWGFLVALAELLPCGVPRWMAGRGQALR